MNNSNNTNNHNDIDLNFNTEYNTNHITMITGAVLFVIGSIEMIARPLISFTHDLHLARYYKK